MPIRVKFPHGKNRFLFIILMHQQQPRIVNLTFSFWQINKYIYTRMYVCLYVCLSVCLSVCRSVGRSVCMYVCVCVAIHVDSNKYVTKC